MTTHVFRQASLADVPAGITVAALVLPLSLGLAVTAGLPPAAGLYASMLPLVAFAFIASSRITMIGPDASVTALLVASVIPMAASSGAQLADLTAALAIAAGACCLLAAALGAGRIAGLLEESALIGYLAGLAVVVGVAQLPRVLGMQVDADTTIGIIVGVLDSVAQVDLASALLGIGTLVLVIVARARRPALPWMLVAVILAAAVSELAGLPEQGVATIGQLPSGLPSLALPEVDRGAVLDLMPIALAVAVVTFADTIATAAAFAARHHEALRPGHDLAALGVADVVAGLSGGMPVSASGARTAAADTAGGRSQLTGLVAAACVALVLVVGGGLVSTLPLPALGGVVIAAVIPMVDAQSLARLRRLERRHFREALLVVAAVVFIGVLEGIVVAFGVSILDRLVTRWRRRKGP